MSANLTRRATWGNFSRPVRPGVIAAQPECVPVAPDCSLACWWELLLWGCLRLSEIGLLGLFCPTADRRDWGAFLAVWSFATRNVDVVVVAAAGDVAGAVVSAVAAGVDVLALVSASSSVAVAEAAAPLVACIGGGKSSSSLFVRALSPSAARGLETMLRHGLDACVLW